MTIPGKPVLSIDHACSLEAQPTFKQSCGHPHLPEPLRDLHLSAAEKIMTEVITMHA